MTEVNDGVDTIIADRAAQASIAQAETTPATILGKRATLDGDIVYSDAVVGLPPLVETKRFENVGFDIDSVLLNIIGHGSNEIDPQHVWDEQTGDRTNYYREREIGIVTFDFTNPLGVTTTESRKFVAALKRRETLAKVCVCL
jgi:hypothetical protein